MKNKIFVFWGLFIFVGCQQKCEIYKLNVEIKDKDYLRYTEYYVVDNPPVSRDTLIKYIVNYNNKTLLSKQKDIKKYTRFIQVFYQETFGINRNYKPSFFFFDIDDIRENYSHEEDRILTLVHKMEYDTCLACSKAPYFIGEGKYDGTGKF
ncbi:hypothetical protein [Arcicella rosea]|uniref:Uncharacterized protein n=1 Tax=Arcicella rosea TaxID=502909 RepID=A0A841EJM1_9BACT|nr:hypothetical protein [Arcicella rosea]MBB6003732.1 hypothetical protein [Arcicella rosea]